ncbi:hypothetical protein PGT21_033156 [Puccinia graminis f. sp. tritici]|uniref:Uncharacterized protein n=1 Tax=Puccinia graminis f. sp. tritici TaxID=56615 RepID=A0A5B0PSW9_PUCGR|nr:hypothetical protein PGT21_033156 [Puccinia graminis f. sp. tritici]
MWWGIGQAYAGPTHPIHWSAKLCRHALSAELTYDGVGSSWPCLTQPIQPGFHQPANGGGRLGSHHAPPIIT